MSLVDCFRHRTQATSSAQIITAVTVTSKLAQLLNVDIVAGPRITKTVCVLQCDE